MYSIAVELKSNEAYLRVTNLALRWPPIMMLLAEECGSGAGAQLLLGTSESQEQCGKLGSLPCFPTAAALMEDPNYTSLRNTRCKVSSEPCME